MVCTKMRKDIDYTGKYENIHDYVSYKRRQSIFLPRIKFDGLEQQLS